MFEVNEKGFYTKHYEGGPAEFGVFRRNEDSLPLFSDTFVLPNIGALRSFFTGPVYVKNMDREVSVIRDRYFPDAGSQIYYVSYGTEFAQNGYDAEFNGTYCTIGKADKYIELSLKEEWGYSSEEGTFMTLSEAIEWIIESWTDEINSISIKQLSKTEEAAVKTIFNIKKDLLLGEKRDNRAYAKILCESTNACLASEAIYKSHHERLMEWISRTHIFSKKERRTVDYTDDLPITGSASYSEDDEYIVACSLRNRISRTERRGSVTVFHRSEKPEDYVTELFEKNKKKDQKELFSFPDFESFMKNSLSDNNYYEISFENANDKSAYEEYEEKEGFNYLFNVDGALKITRFNGHAVPTFNYYGGIETFPCRSLEEGFNILLYEQCFEEKKRIDSGWTYSFADQTSDEMSLISQSQQSLMHAFCSLSKASGEYDVHLSVMNGAPLYHVCPMGTEPSTEEYKQGKKAVIAVNIGFNEAINYVQNLGATENNIDLSTIEEETLQAYYESNILYAKYFEKKADAELIRIMDLYNRLNKMGIDGEYTSVCVDVSDARGDEPYKVFSEMKKACFSREDYNEFCRIQSCTLFHADSVNNYLYNKYNKYSKTIYSHYKVGNLDLLPFCPTKDTRILELLFSMRDRY